MDRSSVTQWIDGFKEGDPDAAAKIWRRYGSSPLRLARRNLRNTRTRVSDEEDIAMMAFEHFCLGVQQGRFAKLENRDDLWQLLVMLTKRRSLDPGELPAGFRDELQDIDGDNLITFVDLQLDGPNSQRVLFCIARFGQ